MFSANRMSIWLSSNLVCVLLSTAAFALDLEVREGEIFELPSKSGCFEIDELVLKRGSGILIGESDVCLHVKRLKVAPESYISAFGRLSEPARSGEPGRAAGENGQDGSPGRDAGNLTMEIGELLLIEDSSGLLIDLSGEDGGAGGKGALGVPGVVGFSGRDGRGRCHGFRGPDGPDYICVCTAKPSNGGNGETGGKGGDGGLGGPGGDGGDIKIVLDNGNSRRVIALSEGGAGGVGGLPGEGGPGGQGGLAGDNILDECPPAYNGAPGPAGPSGNNFSTINAKSGDKGLVSIR